SLECCKKDLALNKKVLEAVEAYTKNSSNLTDLLTLVKDLDFPSIKSTIESLQADIISQNDHRAKRAESFALMAWSVGPKMTRIENTYATIQSNMAILKTDTDDIKAMGKGEKLAHIVTESPFITPSPEKAQEKPTEPKETPFQPEGEQSDMVIEEPKEAKVPEEKPLVTQVDPVLAIIPTTINSKAQSSKLAHPPIIQRTDKGKGIATDNDPSLLKLVKASKKVCPYPDALVLIDYEIDGKTYKITHEEL
nr:hypothetical protein [Tanacetum cinerariifolium]